MLFITLLAALGCRGTVDDGDTAVSTDGGSSAETTPEGGVQPDSLADAAFAMDLSTASWVEPEGGEILFGQLFEGLLLVGVEEADLDQIDLIGGAAEVLDDGRIQQDPCVATFDFEPVDFSENPWLDVGPTTLDLEFQGIGVPIQQVYISGTFSEDGMAIDDASLAAELDARDMAGSLGMSADELCSLLTSYVGLSCVACSEDDNLSCVSLQVEDIEADRVDGLRVVPNEDPEECDPEGSGGGS